MGGNKYTFPGFMRLAGREDHGMSVSENGPCSLMFSCLLLVHFRVENLGVVKTSLLLSTLPSEFGEIASERP